MIAASEALAALVAALCLLLDWVNPLIAHKIIKTATTRNRFGILTGSPFVPFLQE
jgi:hypothetical protein